MGHSIRPIGRQREVGLDTEKEIDRCLLVVICTKEVAVNAIPFGISVGPKARTAERVGIVSLHVLDLVSRVATAERGPSWRGWSIRVDRADGIAAAVLHGDDVAVRGVHRLQEARRIAFDVEVRRRQQPEREELVLEGVVANDSLGNVGAAIADSSARHSADVEALDDILKTICTCVSYCQPVASHLTLAGGRAHRCSSSG